jgi:hypothetical protein
MWFPYNSMGACRHIPSEGLLLKFNGDLIHLALVRGSNLEQPISFMPVCNGNTYCG